MFPKLLQPVADWYALTLADGTYSVALDNVGNELALALGGVVALQVNELIAEHWSNAPAPIDVTPDSRTTVAKAVHL